jgi:N-acetylglucosamine kinase-like BadF-type ATPase
MKIFAGIDSGGTRARLALVQEDGRVIGYAEGKSCCFTDQGMDGAREALQTIWQEAWLSTGTSVQPATALFLGLGSILAGADARINCELAVSLGLASESAIQAQNDAWNAMVGGLCGRAGVLLIAGTGSACLGRNAAGEVWRAGGWGYKLDDRGSAFALGRAAMIAATRDADGRGAPTSLTKMVIDALHLSSMEEIFRRLHHEGGSRHDIAAFAPQVIQAAQSGDAVALAIVKEGADGLVEMVATVSRKLQLSKPDLALTGGLLSNSLYYQQRFLEKMVKVLPGFTIVQDGLPPVLGAVMLAAESVFGKPLPSSFIENLRNSAARLEQVPS